MAITEELRGFPLGPFGDPRYDIVTHCITRIGREDTSTYEKNASQSFNAFISVSPSTLY
jgi:hypothetical protein